MHKLILDYNGVVSFELTSDLLSSVLCLSEVFSGRKAYDFLRKPIRLLKENGDCIQIVSIAYSNIFVPEAMLYLDDFLQHFKSMTLCSLYKSKEKYKIS